MVKECIVGETVECMKENIMMTKSMALEFTLGQMDDSITECGKTANSMEKENIYYHQVFKDEENGKMDIENDGLMQHHI